ncbi:MAG: hypothetical protein U0132_03985 [Gemmatimonadaceae bacterium]
MISRKRDFGSIDAQEAAELHRDSFSVLAHDLGSIASALALRADALATLVPGTDVAALHALSEQIRDANRTARLLKGPARSSVVAPHRSTTVDDWWRLTHRLAVAVLPRGVRLETRFANAVLSNADASVLTHIWLASCKDLVARGLHAPGTIVLSVSPAQDHPDMTMLLAEVGPQEWLPPDTSRAGSRWHRYAARLARLQEATLAWWHVRDNGSMEWSCAFPIVREPTSADVPG